jgi:hypothetical protein
MAEFCSICEPEYFDINLAKIALDLEQGHSENILCEGCGIKAVYKDEVGALFLGILENGEIVLKPIQLESL